MSVPKWTGVLVGKMHNEQVSNIELANELGFTVEYVSMVLNGRKKPANAKERFNRAFVAIIERRKA